jgi:hypothetical protein
MELRLVFDGLGDRLPKKDDLGFVLGKSWKDYSTEKRREVSTTEFIRSSNKQEGH